MQSIFGHFCRGITEFGVHIFSLSGPKHSGSDAVLNLFDRMLPLHSHDELGTKIKELGCQYIWSGRGAFEAGTDDCVAIIRLNYMTGWALRVRYCPMLHFSFEVIGAVFSNRRENPLGIRAPSDLNEHLKKLEAVKRPQN